MTKRILLATIGLAAACGDDLDSAGDYVDDDVPSGSCMSESGDADCDPDTMPADDDDGPVTAASDDECEGSIDCDAGEVCMATFDGDIGEFECRAACIPDRDETRWCVDDAACCEIDSVCSQRGYCLPPAATGTTTSDGTTSDTTSDTSTTDEGTTSDGTTGDGTTTGGAR